MSDELNYADGFIDGVSEGHAAAKAWIVRYMRENVSHNCCGVCDAILSCADDISKGEYEVSK